MRMSVSKLAVVGAAIIGLVLLTGVAGLALQGARGEGEDVSPVLRPRRDLREEIPGYVVHRLVYTEPI